MDKIIRKNDTNKRSSVDFLTGLLFGTLAGFGAMMLFAPQSGKKTRTQIEEKSIELQDRATDTYDALITISHFDYRKILTGTQEITENKHAVIENLSNQASSIIKTEMQIMTEELLYNDSLGG